MKQTGNQKLVKQINKSIVLDLVKNKAPLSRADIAQISKLNKGTVSSLVSELIDDHFIIEVGPGESSGGRRPVLLHFNAGAGFIIGLDIGVDYILGILTDLKGEIIEENYISLEETNYDYVLDNIGETILLLKNSAPLSPYNIVGIGVGVPGIVDHNGHILFAPNLEWREKNLKADLEREFNLPVRVENEANCGAYGEKLFGSNSETNDLIYISAGIGIGSGIIMNGKLYRGQDGFSGELGHMVIEREGLLCNCGSHGCWEMYASENALIKDAKERGLLKKEDPEMTPLLQLTADAKNGNQPIIDLFQELGVNIGLGLNNIINTFNPEKVIIGNRLAMAEEWLSDTIAKVINNQTLSYHQRNVEISFSNLSNLSSALGVSAFVSEEFFNKVSNALV